MFFLSPEHAVPSKRIAVSSTAARTTAVLVKAPVSHHAPVAASPAHSGFADAVSVGGVARSAVSQMERRGARGVTVARCKI